MVSVLVPSGVSSPGNKGVHKLIGLSVWFGLSQVKSKCSELFRLQEKLFSFHAGHHAKLCSHQFVLNVASQTSVSIEFAPDCSWIQCTQCKCAHFIHDSITLTSCEYDVSSDGALS
ncbi:hypothetical protein T06_12683 [Trichinella sp. T6]|nr:hypothetical protein T06_12683 [Trichinella sp. T6]